MLHFEFEQDRLAEAHSLKAFELAQRAVEVPFEARFVPARRFQLHLL